MIGLEFFRKLYSPEGDLTIFDIGAHYGDSVSEFVTLFPSSHVYAFEPDSKNRERLIRRFSTEYRVEVLEMAIGEKDGRALLHKNNYDATHSLLPFDSLEINRWADANDFHAEGVEEVHQISLDSFCILNEIPYIDILKLDIQGGELMALQGAKNKLSKEAIGGIFCEVEFRQLYQNQPLFCDITRYLASYAYHFVNLTSPKVSEMGVLSWADAIYVNEPLWRSIAAKHSAGKLI